MGLGWAQGYRLLSGGVLGAEWGRGGPWGWLLAPAWCADAGRSGVCRRPQHPAPPPPPAFTPTYTASTTPQPTPPHQAAEALDGSGVTFRRDPWARPPGNANAGSGVTAVLEGGELLEKAAVSVTAVRGVLSAPRAAAMAARQQRGGGGGGEGGGGGPATPRPPRAGDPYAAAALSLVFHPASPHVPTLRGDVRVFEVGGRAVFGGGADLTPAYAYEEDAADFHAHWKGVCARFHAGLYPELKAACDDYFFLPARGERRGVGGIFFDDVPAEGGGGGGGGGGAAGAAPASAAVDGAGLARAVVGGWLASWAPLVARRRHAPVTPAQRDWQLLRRG